MKGGYCVLCRVNAGPAHWSTKSHNRKAWRLSHPTPRRQPRKQRVDYGSQYSLKNVLRIKPYRRSRPEDGAQKVVVVGAHWRELPHGYRKRKRRR